jgi:hypothetical protein
MYCEAVPFAVTANVPELVIGEFATLKADGIVNPTEVTVPELIVQARFADRSNATPFIVNVLEFGTIGKVAKVDLYEVPEVGSPTSIKSVATATLTSN